MQLLAKLCCHVKKKRTIIRTDTAVKRYEWGERTDISHKGSVGCIDVHSFVQMERWKHLSHTGL